MDKCIYCGAINSIAPIRTPDGTEFMLISKLPNGNFNIPPNGLVVNALACNKCGSITLGNAGLIGATFQK